jgi:hypothetical protein
MYPKDLVKHKRVHEGPDGQIFFCPEPGCAAKSSRHDNLMRHYRNKHSTSRSSIGADAESTGASHFDDVQSSTGSHLQGPASQSSVVDHDFSFTTSQTDTSSLDRNIDPRLLSSASAADSHSFSMAG